MTPVLAWVIAMKRLMTLVIILGLLGLGVYLGTRLQGLTSRGTGGVAVVATPMILRQIQALSELVTIKYVYEKVVILEDVKWYGESRVLLVAHGILKAGIDMRTLKEESIQIRGRTITVTLPASVLTDVYLDESKTRVIERNTGALRVFDKDMEQTARRQAIEDLRRAGKQGGILKEAELRAKAQITVLLSAMGFEFVEVRFEDAAINPKNP